jgi:hypothetical protein
MRIRELFETASEGATSAGNIATVANPHIAIGNVKQYGKGKKPKPPKVITPQNKDGTAKNGLDSNISLFGKTALKR